MNVPDARPMSALQGMARLVGLLFHYFAEEAENTMGKEAGRALVTRAIYNMGRERGKRIRERVDAAGLEPTLENLFKFYDLPIGEAWQSQSARSGDCLIKTYTYCPLAEVWKQLGDEERGILYCDIDIAIIEGYNPDITIHPIKNVQRGDERCEYEYT
jgi:hypothetical protein